MTCCGQRRSQASALPPIAASAFAAGPGAGKSRDDVALRYRDGTRLTVRGPATGKMYVFSAGQPTLVASRDAERLLATGSFARA
jgi:hypothetical protein